MAKSPFAKKEVLTFEYPAPLDATERSGEAISPLVIEANKNLIDPEEMEEGHWFRIRVARSRGDVDVVADATQAMLIQGDEGVKFEQKIGSANRRVFELLAEDWSFQEFACTAENYAKLDGWSGDWINACLAEAVRLGTHRDFGKKTKDSLRPPEPSEETASLPEPLAPVSSSETPTTTTGE